MEFKVEPIGEIERQLTIEVPWQDLTAIEDKKLNEIAPKVNIDGFRKGKVPFKLVKQYYGESIRHEALNELIGRVYQEVIENEGLKPAGFPSNLDIEEIKEGQPLKIKAMVEIFPTIQLVDMDSEKVVRVNASISEQDVEVTIKSIQQNHVTWKEVDREAHLHDRVTLDYEGRLNDVPFEGGQATHAQVIIGKKQYINDLEQGLIGLKKGDTKVVAATFPEDYSHKALAGQTAEFHVKVHQVEESVLPEINEDFIKSYGVESGNQEEFYQEVKKGMQRELTEVLKNKFKQVVFNKLLEKNQFPVPKILIEKEIKRLIEERNKMLSQMVGKKVNFNFENKHFEEEATANIKFGLLLPLLFEKYAVEKNDSKIKQVIEDRASAYDNPEQVIRQMYANKEFMHQAEALALEDELIEKMIAKLEIEEQNLPYRDVMDKNKLNVEEEKGNE